VNSEQLMADRLISRYRMTFARRAAIHGVHLVDGYGTMIYFEVPHNILPQGRGIPRPPGRCCGTTHIIRNANPSVASVGARLGAIARHIVRSDFLFRGSTSRWDAIHAASDQSLLSNDAFHSKRKPTTVSVGARLGAPALSVTILHLNSSPGCIIIM